MDRRLNENRAWWDEMVALHADAPFYDLEAVRAGASALDRIEQSEVGDVEHASLLHLQCHFGLSTLSLARMGARVTGVDFSPAAITRARRLATEFGVDARFVCCDLSAVPQQIPEAFDVVFTSYGVLSWLPDLAGWAAVVAHALRPGGRFHLIELHPTACMFDDETPQVRLRYPYFRGPDPIRRERRGSYAVPDADTVHQVTYSWPAAISDVLGALLDVGLHLESLHEFTTCHEQLRPWLVPTEDGQWTTPPELPAVPLVYALRATRPA